MNFSLHWASHMFRKTPRILNCFMVMIIMPAWGLHSSKFSCRMDQEDPNISISPLGTIGCYVKHPGGLSFFLQLIGYTLEVPMSGPQCVASPLDNRPKIDCPAFHNISVTLYHGGVKYLHYVLAVLGLENDARSYNITLPSKKGLNFTVYTDSGEITNISAGTRRVSILEGQLICNTQNKCVHVVPVNFNNTLSYFVLPDINGLMNSWTINCTSTGIVCNLSSECGRDFSFNRIEDNDYLFYFTHDNLQQCTLYSDDGSHFHLGYDDTTNNTTNTWTPNAGIPTTYTSSYKHGNSSASKPMLMPLLFVVGQLLQLLL